MAGKWVYFALVCLAASLLVLEFGVLSVVFSGLLLLRIFLERNLRLFLAFIMIFLCFIVYVQQFQSQIRTDYSSGEITESVEFKQFPLIDGNRLSAIVMAPGNEKLMLVYYIKSEEEKDLLARNLQAGTSCKLKGELTVPRGNTNEHAFNYKRYLLRQNIHWLLEPDQIQLEYCYSKSKSFLNVLQNIRHKEIIKIEESFPEKLIPYAEALLFGERSNFPEAIYHTYKRLGIVHLLAISGLHVGIIIGILYFVLLSIGFTRETTFWMFIFILPIYCVLSGGNPPVIRAVVMALLLLISTKRNISITALDALSLSFSIFLLYDPCLLYHIGFQLSFAVSFGIIMSASFINSKTSILGQMVHVSVVSLIVSIPLLCYHFYEFSIFSIAANILFVPFYTMFVLPGILILMVLKELYFPLFSVGSLFFAQMVDFSEYVTMRMSSFSLATVLTGKISSLSLALIVIFVLIYFFLREKGKGGLYAALPLKLFLLIYLTSVKYSSYGEVVFIDVGQGDSILIKLPYNRGTYLIDTGGRVEYDIPNWQIRKNPFQVGNDVLIPLLKSKGIGKIDKLILTHSHLDHIGAAGQLLDQIKVKQMFITPNSLKDEPMIDLVTTAKGKKTRINIVQAGYGWENESGIFYFISPQSDTFEGNNDSLVLYGDFGHFTWLFTGDAEQEAEEAIVQKYAVFEADVLKVGHHGSRSSSTEPFIKGVRPKYAIISAGRNNRYGHPHNEVVEILTSQKAAIFRTDVHGAIHYKFTSSRRGTFKTVLQYDISNK